MRDNGIQIENHFAEFVNLFLDTFVISQDIVDVM